MKKKKLKNLSLNKKSIAGLNSKQIKGGTGSNGTIWGTVCDLTDGDCINTWGDPTCPTGWDWLCKGGGSCDDENIAQ